MIPIYDPRTSPKLRCAVDRLGVGPGEWPLIQNMRTDQQSLLVRLPDATINASPPSGAQATAGVYSPMGSFQGFANGTAYFLSAWVMTDSTVAIFSQNLSTGAYTEITNAGNASASSWGGTTTGETRFPTTTANVQYTVVSTPRRVLGGATVESIDVFVIQNGTDQPIVYNPGGGYTAQLQVVWSPESISLPTFPNVFRTLISFSAFWEVQNLTAATAYYSSAGPPRVNQTNFNFANSAATYTSTNCVPYLTLGASVNNGDIAAVRFPVSGVTNQETFQGNYLNIIVQGGAAVADITQVLKDCKIELGKENVAYNLVSTWTTIFDPTSTDASISTLPTFVTVGDAANLRVLIPYSLQEIATASLRTAYHIRLTWLGSTAPGAALHLFFLGIMSTGAGGGFPYGTEWTAVYSDHYSFAESGPFVQAGTDADWLNNCGGPKGPDSTTDAPITLPKSTSIWYDYRMKVKMPNSNTAIQGGLNGQPSHLDFYFRNPVTETTALYWSSWEIWAPTHGATYFWQSNAQSGAGGVETLRTEQVQSAGSSPDGFGYGTFGLADYYERDPGVPAPNDFNECMPKAACIASAVQRLFCGNNYYASVTTYSHQELKFSDAGFFGRFRSVQDNTDANSGGRLTFPGEIVKTIKTSAAAAQAAVTIYVWTDKSFNALGTAGGYTFVGSSFNGFNLGQQFRISADGTQEPSSVIERNGRLSWVNTNGHIVYTEGGQPVNISVGWVTNSQGVSNTSVLDVIADIPASRRGRVRGVYARNRFYWFMTPSGATVNSRCLIFDTQREIWETLDTLTNGEWAVPIYDSSQAGAGQRVLLHGTDGITYGYEEGSGTVSARWTTGGVMFGDIAKDGMDGWGYTIKEMELISDVDTAHTLAVSCYQNMNPSGTPVVFTFYLDTNVTDEWLVENNITSGTPLPSWGTYFDVSGTVTGGKKISKLSAKPEPVSRDNRQRHSA